MIAALIIVDDAGDYEFLSGIETCDHDPGELHALWAAFQRTRTPETPDHDFINGLTGVGMNTWEPADVRLIELPRGNSPWPKSSELLEMLDNVSASLENVLVYLCANTQTANDDMRNRWKLCQAARRVCNEQLRPEDKGKFW